MQFVKLRLSGFKSFVEPTELLIEAGLTGIVGPNGCGKSNLVEALRWVMGETSAKQMRGGEMEDVIFNGSANRPPRNLAEVSLGLDNADRTAPAAFNDSDEIEVRRRIERGAGSAYRINGGEARARDVQLLFADAATGARSTAMVSQGRIGAIINAKPAARRSVVEEAAGITGLYSRRHEAELRLRGAETNLERLEDVLAAFETQLQNLERQARQAARYREIGGKIRQAESLLLARQWRQAEEEHETAQASLKSSETQVAECTARLAKVTARQADAAGGLPALREAEAAAAAALQRLTLERDQLAAEERRLEDLSRECAARLVQIEEDMARESSRRDETAAALENLDQEEQRLNQDAGNQDDSAAQAKTALDHLSGELRDLEANGNQLAEKLAADEARRTGLRERLAADQRRLDEITQRLAASEADPAMPPGGETGAADLAGLEQAAEDAQKHLSQRQAAAEAQSAKVLAAQEDLEKTRRATAGAEADLAQLTAEKKALTSMLEGGGDAGTNPIGDAITITPGFEAAVAAALGEGLTAPLDETGSVGWRALPPLADPPPLPGGVRALIEVVDAPAALHRRLAMAGLAETRDQARQLQSQLIPGQCLVMAGGGLWRWDGYTAETDSETAAVQRLRQRRRLDELKSLIIESQGQTATAQEALQAAQDKAGQEKKAEIHAQEDIRTAYEAAGTARSARAAAVEADMRRRAEAEARAAEIARLQQEAERLGNDNDELQSQLDALDGIEQDRQTLSGLRDAAEAKRRAVMDAQRTHDDLLRDIRARAGRLTEIAAERGRWRDRLSDNQAQIQRLSERQAVTHREIERLADSPQDFHAKRQEIESRLAEAEAGRTLAAKTLADAEDVLAEADRQLKHEQTGLNQAREDRVRREAAAEQSQSGLDRLAVNIRERLECEPSQLREQTAQLKGREDSLEKIDGRLKRLLRERDNLGAVNLRAEQEAAEITEQLDSMRGERDDLLSAIARLRKGISGLNREGRERLLAAFEKVDAHFRELFVRLFGGGRAHMKLVDADDPLEAGLEIYASPPGKKLQTLTLLSGGEQALAATALLFSVFLTNPAPICVLDEVDAPLDDANVDRFCDLIKDIAETTRTRFLLITHHRLTMARMHRLYGVTMTERGVSRIVSVDLQRAEELREAV